MQPYLFPYLGYFQVIHAVETFVFYDDVNFINRGWINRNTILLNGKSHRITVPLEKASQNKKINAINISKEQNWKNNLLKTITQAYQNAEYFSDVISVVTEVLNNATNNSIAHLSMESVRAVCNYLGLEKEFEVSSEEYTNTINLKGADRLIEITKNKGYRHYINPQGGLSLYTKEYFEKRGIRLSFIENDLTPYEQFGNEPITGLSVIDVLMFNSKKNILQMLNQYRLN